MASLKIISFNPDSPFNDSAEFRDFLRHQIFQRGDVDLVAFQETIWAISAASIRYAEMGVRELYHVYGSYGSTVQGPNQALGPRESALFVRKLSMWEVVGFYGLQFLDAGSVPGALDITPIIQCVPATRQSAVRRRLVVVQLRNDGMEVTIASYHGLNNGITNDVNFEINKGLLKGILWMSNVRQSFGWLANCPCRRFQPASNQYARRRTRPQLD